MIEEKARLGNREDKRKRESQRFALKEETGGRNQDHKLCGWYSDHDGEKQHHEDPTGWYY